MSSMNNLKEQILNLYQNWYDEYNFDTWHPYYEEIRLLSKLLKQIYNLVKDYEETTDSTIKRIKEEKGLSPICDNEDHTSGITYI